MTEAGLKRALDLEKLVLGVGFHKSIEEGMCVMEAVAYVAGERWTDQPSCASPVIAAFLRRWNDALDDAGRQRLKPLIPRLVGSKASRQTERRRGWLATDWIVRTGAPAWLRLCGLEEQAVALEQLPPLSDAATARAASSGALQTSRDAASSLRADARQRLMEKVRAAFPAADAAYKKWSVYDAVYAAVKRAATEKLAPTRASLQDSALELVDRMLALTDEAA